MRIISGFHKGRRIRPSKKLPVRPTTDKSKEAIFNILSNRFDLECITVLDLFSGTGSISYEFCSRGGINVVALDHNKNCINFIKATSNELKFPIKAIQNDVFVFLKKTKLCLDVIFADPPYAMDIKKFDILIDIIFSRELLNNGGLLIIEHSKQVDLSQNKKFEKTRSYGSNCFSFFEKKQIYKPNSVP